MVSIFGKKLSTIEKIKLSSDILGSVGGIGATLRSAAADRDVARSYATNALLATQDADEAVRIGQENAQIVNIERYKTKGKQLSYFAGSGFAAGSGSYADTIANTESEYYKTIAAIHYDAEAKKNSFNFESKRAKIESNYMRKVAGIRSRAGIITGITGIVSSIAMTGIDTEVKAEEE